MIDSKDISVVVQGAIKKKEAKKCLNSIRKYLPNAEIILSTWKGSNVNNLNYDILVENEDPGAIIFCGDIYNNINRQLLSTQNGLKKVTRQYVLKLRTDFYLAGSDFLNYFEKFPKRNEKYSLFKHRVIIPTVYSRLFSEETLLPVLFHPSDFYMFGKTEDIKAYFMNTDLAPTEDMANYDIEYSQKPYKLATWRYTPEQYFCWSYVKQFYKDITFEHCGDYSKELKELSDNILFNNFIFLDISASSILSKKHFKSLKLDSSIPGIIFLEKFAKKYKCDYASDFNSEDLFTNKYKFNKHKYRLLDYVEKFNIFISEVFSFIYYGLLTLKEMISK